MYKEKINANYKVTAVSGSLCLIGEFEDESLVQKQQDRKRLSDSFPKYLNYKSVTNRPLTCNRNSLKNKQPNCTDHLIKNKKKKTQSVKKKRYLGKNRSKQATVVLQE